MLMNAPCAAVAVLFTESGPLQIYHAKALRAVVETLPKRSMSSCDTGFVAGHNGVATIVPSISHCSQNRVVGGAWDLEQWRHWGRKKSAVASTICKLNGSLKARIADLEAQLSGTTNPKSTEQLFGGVPTSGFCNRDYADNADEDPLRRNDPWANRDGHGDLAVRAVVEDSWAAWQPQWLRHGRVRNLKLHPLPPRLYPDSSADGCGESCTSFVRQSSCTEFERTQKRTVEKTNGTDVKGDWRALPRDDFKNMYMKFPDNPLRTTPDEYVQQRWPSSCALRGAARHLRRYGYSATLPDVIHYPVDTCELKSLREVFRVAQ